MRFPPFRFLFVFLLCFCKVFPGGVHYWYALFLSFLAVWVVGLWRISFGGRSSGLPAVVVTEWEFCFGGRRTPIKRMGGECIAIGGLFAIRKTYGVLLGRMWWDPHRLAHPPLTKMGHLLWRSLTHGARFFVVSMFLFRIILFSGAVCSRCCFLVVYFGRVGSFCGLRGWASVAF